MTTKDPTLAQIAERILQDQFQRLIHNTLITQHRAHKLLLASLDPTSRLPHCSICRLPCLLDPPLAPKVRGTPSSSSSEIQYCERRPWSRRPGHDIYDNPFPKADATGRPPTKKEREAQAAKAKNGTNGIEGTPASEENGSGAQNGTGPPSPSEADGEQERKLEKGEKKASKIDEKLKKGEYVPWHTCPSCKRSLLITRFAKHLEQCMGLSGRQASRNAMARIQGSTPAGSRQGTPGVGQESGGARQAGAGAEREEDEEEEGGKGGKMHRKVLKKSLANKLKKERVASGKGGKGAAKRPPGGGSTVRSSPALSQAEKRDADEMLGSNEANEDDEDTIHIQKRQKMSRISSIASMGSQQSTVPPGSALIEERGESADGSFGGDGEEGEASE
ncbi:hypothetical protein B0A54_07341 [Friedmanniomyces endolithicus]|uniref:SAGA-associated factor 11 n=1 Tax=Friedmanniomyces endolithicus TaxID=329885 RepID=A0A4U0V1L2_9PEZI|nr:hypothetical protein LTS09_007738 [Friedmanniomyces endolithicus]TKA42253.1 hypothetical protein B0A54_07341 [Friedmanniomyces endolithicus]